MSGSNRSTAGGPSLSKKSWVTQIWIFRLVSCELRRDDRLRLGGEAVQTQGQRELSLFPRE
jgi:hypothetical protein